MAETVNTPTDRRAGSAPNFNKIVAISLEMQRAKTLAKRASELDLPVLLEGEPGSGKRLLARSIHAASPRSNGPFHALRFNARDPRQASESDAAANAPDPAPDYSVVVGRAWQAAANGTLFLENICDMPSAVQDQLQERLQRQSSKRADEPSHVRVICSSGRNLVELVKSGKFSEKLYYQISVFPIWLPPLRTRTEDIVPLSKMFLGQIVAEVGKPITTIEPTAESLLRSYSWPGNVRQLENTIFRAVALADGYELTLRDFPQLTAQIPGYDRPSQGTETALPAAPAAGAHYEGPAMIGGTMHADRPIALTPLSNSPLVGVPATNPDGEFRRLEEIEADIIRLALGHYRGHITEIARRLGIGRSTLYRKMREFGLTPRHN